MNKLQVGVLGATSPVGGQLLELLTNNHYLVYAFSRQPVKQTDADVKWHQLRGPGEIENSSGINALSNGKITIPLWICTAPIWVLSQYFDLMERCGVQRIVALSSTSRFTKADSPDPAEQAVASQLVEGEQRLQAWVQGRGVEWIILRPTLIYGLGRDKNVTEIARLIRRWRFFPLLSEGRGLRQPVHVLDVATACESAIRLPAARNRAYALSGGEVLSYREMVTRVFTVLGKKPRFIRFPRWVFCAMLAGLRILPRFRHWSAAMAERMERDMVFDHQEANTYLGFSPQPFKLEQQDMPLGSSR